MIHHNTEKTSTKSFTNMETPINPQHIVHNRLGGHQTNTEQTTIEPFYLDLGRKIQSNKPGGQIVSVATLRTPCGSNDVEQPLDLSPANSPRTAPPTSPTTHNVEASNHFTKYFATTEFGTCCINNQTIPSFVTSITISILIFQFTISVTRRVTTRGRGFIQALQIRAHPAPMPSLWRQRFWIPLWS